VGTDGGVAGAESHFIATRYPEALKEAFPAALWHGGARFWIQKR
jgi:hypothetical protein